ncbi:MAG: WbqC family protein [Sulfuricellaceae bacterium]
MNMKKTVVIHQPDFAPYIGFFHRFLHADLYLVLDHVQFVNGTSRAWTHRDKIKTPKGAQWLTLSVKKTPRDTPINRVELSKSVNWRTDHLRILEANYRNAPFYEEIIPHLRNLYNQSVSFLMEFNLLSIEMLMDLLDVRIPTMLSSEQSPQGAKNELLIDLLQKAGATHYLSGVGARDYLETHRFNDAGIKVVWQNFTHPIYPQLFGEFIPNLSSLDLLFNCGVSGARQVLRSAA